ncbi:HNH endonuclease signature motif containing protein [Rhodoferax sp. GW822-FHT02A01]|uniref:HNH endonuclease n=1 Tax=Rhodoferax sp. GW822-FHT02A01 TaxID=3141537 RepID=UPI00315D83FA
MSRVTNLRPRVEQATGRLQTMQAGAWRTPNQSSAQRGYGYKWQKAREAFLYANPLCKMCQDEGQITAASIVDHKEPHRGDQKLFWDERNWQSLCTHHHSSQKQREEHEAQGYAPNGGGRVESLAVPKR